MGDGVKGAAAACCEPQERGTLVSGVVIESGQALVDQSLAMR